jgi:hypothetical protein
VKLGTLRPNETTTMVEKQNCLPPIRFGEEELSIHPFASIREIADIDFLIKVGNEVFRSIDWGFHLPINKKERWLGVQNSSEVLKSPPTRFLTSFQLFLL